METPPTRHIRFGPFEVDLHARELRKAGRKVKLQEQPFQVLTLMLARPGDMVSREEIRQELWSADTFVDFDVNLNGIVKKLREALGDSAEKPRFVETLPRRGYRFIAPIDAQAAVPACEEMAAAPYAAAASQSLTLPSMAETWTEPKPPLRAKPRRRRLVIVALVLGTVFTTVIGVLAAARIWNVDRIFPPNYKMTFEYDRDRSGLDIKDVTGIALEDCANACLDDGECQAYSYRKSNKQCWLKKGVPLLTTDDDFVSGVKYRVRTRKLFRLR